MYFKPNLIGTHCFSLNFSLHLWGFYKSEAVAYVLLNDIAQNTVKKTFANNGKIGPSSSSRTGCTAFVYILEK